MKNNKIRIGIIIIKIIIIILIAIICFEYFKLRENEHIINQGIKYINITDDKAKAELDKDNTIIILDVRTKEEYEEQHIPNSILIPVDELENRALNELLDKQAKIFVYCRSGVRSITASEILVNLGYEKVYNLGGIINWKYETE